MTRLLTALVAAVCLSAPAAAQTVTWAGPAAGGSWSVAANWSSNPQLPGPDSVVGFGASINTAATISLDGSQTVRAVRVGGATGAVTLTAGTPGTSTLTLRGNTGGDLVADTADLFVQPTLVVGDSATVFSTVVANAAAGRTVGLSRLDLSGTQGAERRFVATSGAGGAVELSGGLTAVGNGTNLIAAVEVGSGSRLRLTASQTWTPVAVGMSVNGPGDLELGTPTAPATLTVAPGAAGGRNGGAVFGARLTGGGGLTLAPATASPSDGLVVVRPGSGVANTATGALTVSGGTLQLAGPAAWAGTAVSVTGGQLLIGSFNPADPNASNPPVVFNALPADTVLSISGSGAYNLGQPDPATGSLADSRPRPHVQTYAGVSHAGSGAFNTGSTGGAPQGVTVTGTFTHSGGGELRVNSGGRLEANALTLPAFGGPVVVEGFAPGGGNSGVLGVGPGGLTLAGRTITLAPAAGGTEGGVLGLGGPVQASGTSRIGGASGLLGTVVLGSPTRAVDVSGGGTLTLAATLINGDTSSGPNGLVKTGAGELVLAGPRQITFSTTRLEAGRLVLADAAALGVPSSGSPDLFAAGRLTLAGGALDGATVSTAGGADGAGVSVSAGSLLFDGTTATLELGDGPHVLRFFRFDGGSGLDLTITGWEGEGGGSGTAGRILFDQSGAFDQTFLSRIDFEGFGAGARLLDLGAGNGFELVPVPEPAGLLLLAAGLLGRRRPARVSG